MDVRTERLWGVSGRACDDGHKVIWLSVSGYRLAVASLKPDNR